MRKLLSAGFMRLWRNKALYLALVGVLLLAVSTVMNGVRMVLADAFVFTRYLENFYFDTAVYSGIFLSAVIALFIGVEYSDATLRNKIIVGHSRTNIYLANLVFCSTVSLLLTVAWMLGGMVGIPVLGVWVIGVKGMLLALLISVLAAVSLSSVFLMISMLLSNRAVSAVACISLSLMLVLAASSPYNALCEPEFQSGLTMTVEGVLKMMEPTPNPRYIGGALRTVYSAVVNILPTGQQILLANITSDEGIANYPLQIAGSVLFTACTTGIGVFLFRRKDLK